MVVYIEDAILDNLVINSIILFLSLFSLRQKIKILKVICASLLGCVVSIALTFFSLPLFLTILIKFLLGLILSSIVIQKFSFKLLSLFYVVFLTFTFVMGGFCFFIIYLFGGEVYSITNMTYNLPISLGVIFIFLGIYAFLLIHAIKVFYKKQKLASFYYDVILHIQNKKIKIKAYLDSGNLLQDNLTGLPILIVNFNTFNKIFNGKVSVFNFLKNTLNQTIKGRYIDVSTISSNGKMFVIEPNKVEIKQDGTQLKEIKVLVGVSSNTSKSGQFEALLSPLAL